MTIQNPTRLNGYIYQDLVKAAYSENAKDFGGFSDIFALLCSKRPFYIEQGDVRIDVF